jgi:hypothetical protein
MVEFCAHSRLPFCLKEQDKSLKIKKCSLLIRQNEIGASRLLCDDRLEPHTIDNNKAPPPPTNDSARSEFDRWFVADLSSIQGNYMISRGFLSVANNSGYSVAFNLASDRRAKRGMYRSTELAIGLPAHPEAQILAEKHQPFTKART